MNQKQRCEWAAQGELEIAYHDVEWGVPVHDDRKLFELLVLEGAQAGLSWSTILKKRARYRQVYDDFDPTKVACYDETKFAQLLKDPGIVRNKLKITASVSNAQLFLDIQREFGSFDMFIWRFVDGITKHNNWKSLKEVPASTPESDAMSKALKQRGFKFVGSTICYAFMQAAGMVNDHTVNCFRYRELRN